MKKIFMIFLQWLSIIIGLVVLVFMIIEPQLEGRNVSATLSEIYLHDGFLLWAYTGSIAFFVGLYNAFKLFSYIRDGKTISTKSVQALATIKYSALVLVGFLLFAQGYLVLVQRQVEGDIAGGVAMSMMLLLISVTVAIVSARSERLLRNKMQ